MFLVESNGTWAAVHCSGWQTEWNHIPLRRARTDLTDQKAWLQPANQNDVFDRV